MLLCMDISFFIITNFAAMSTTFFVCCFKLLSCKNLMESADAAPPFRSWYSAAHKSSDAWQTPASGPLHCTSMIFPEHKIMLAFLFIYVIMILHYSLEIRRASHVHEPSDRYAAEMQADRHARDCEPWLLGIHEEPAGKPQGAANLRYKPLC